MSDIKLFGPNEEYNLEDLMKKFNLDHRNHFKYLSNEIILEVKELSHKIKDHITTMLDEASSKNTDILDKKESIRSYLYDKSIKEVVNKISYELDIPYENIDGDYINVDDIVSKFLDKNNIEVLLVTSLTLDTCYIGTRIKDNDQISDTEMIRLKEFYDKYGLQPPTIFKL